MSDILQIANKYGVTLKNTDVSLVSSKSENYENCYEYCLFIKICYRYVCIRD